MKRILRSLNSAAAESIIDLTTQNAADALRDCDELFRGLGASLEVRVVVRLRLAGYSSRQIARKLHVPEHVIRDRQAAARRLLASSTAFASGSIKDAIAADTIRPATRMKYRPSPSPWRARVTLRSKGATGSAPDQSEKGTEISAQKQGSVRGRERAGGKLTAAQAFGWREVYYSEVHRYHRRG